LQARAVFSAVTLPGMGAQRLEVGARCD